MSDNTQHSSRGEDHMLQWMSEVFGSFPGKDTIEPIDRDKFESASDDEKREMLSDLEQNELDWFKEQDVVDQITPAESLDYYMVEFAGYMPSKWAERRSRGKESIRKNVRQARNKLELLHQIEGENYKAPEDN